METLNKETILKLCKILYDKKAMDIRAIEVTAKTIIADWFIVASGRGVPQVKALCDECGVECIVALSHDNPDRGVKYRHAWNVVKLEGKWYHVDATFDNSLQRGVKRYDYFGLDDKRLFRDHERLVLPLPACSDGDSFLYRTISLTKLEQVESRVKQALRKKEPHFVFHWRGGGLNRAILGEILALARAQAAAKGKEAACAVNVTQAVIQLDFTDTAAELTVQQPDENREDVPEMDEN